MSGGYLSGGYLSGGICSRISLHSDILRRFLAFFQLEGFLAPEHFIS